MSRIEILPDHLVSQIAAGEVVERPASVVKELLENALDAAAKHVEIDLESGGKRRIRIRDDGVGMDRDDALRAFDRHATSKIASFEDLEAVETLGFRGEALASIAAVARVELVTATEPGEGFRVRIEGGDVRVAEPIAAARGTTLDIRSLFYNVPARRRFLKTPRAELQRSTEVLQAYALTRPDVSITARHEGRVLLDAPAAGSGIEGLERRLQGLYGDEFVSRLVALEPATRRDLTIWGFVGDARTARSRRRFTFVNRRLVRDRGIMATFYRAVRDEWRSDEFPALFIFLDLPGERVDVNVHPQKSEVRFRDRSVLDELYRRLRDTLGHARGEEPLRPVASTSLPGTPLAWTGRPAAGGASREAGPGPEWRFPAEVAEPTPGAGGGPEAPPVEGRLPQASFEPMSPRPVPLSGRSGQELPFRLLGQYKGTVLLLEGTDGLYLIDQHVAHERVLFERIRRNIEADNPQTQTLLAPHLVELSRAELLRLEPLLDALEACGIQAAPVSDRTLGLTGVPVDMGLETTEGAIRSLAQSREGGESPADLRRRLLEDAAASMSCRAAVKMHDVLTREEMEHLVSELFEAEYPYACPHGRPVIMKLSDVDLEKGFKRR